MRNLIRNVVVGIALAAVIAVGLGERRSNAESGARCAPVVVKMPCL